MSPELRINADRLSARLAELARIGEIEGGGVCRLALSDEDRAARDLVCGWMRDLGMTLSIDKLGNAVAIRKGQVKGNPVMTGSHIDTVTTGGRFDGNLGVLAGLEVIATLNDAGVTTQRPLAVGFFTNEEGVRYAPDMMGSGVQQGALALDVALDTVGIDGTVVGEELRRIGYAGDADVGGFRAHRFIELHVEQGPVLEQKGITIGAVTGVQGISWNEIEIMGTSNHAGTTPMQLRNDAGYVAAAIAVRARQLAKEMGGTQVATVGVTELVPNLVNVIAKQAKLTVDLRNIDESLLAQAEQRLTEFMAELAIEEGVTIQQRSLARFAPVQFAQSMIELIEHTASALGYSCRRLPSGAGHDAQMFAPNCPTAMIFVPSVGGTSHNVTEYTPPEQLAAGANVLLQAVLRLAQA